MSTQAGRNQRLLPKKIASSRPAGLALATLAGEDKETPASFEAVLGTQNFQKYLPVNEEAVNKGVEQFRKHIGKVLRHDSAELEQFINCMGFSEEEIRAPSKALRKLNVWLKARNEKFVRLKHDEGWYVFLISFN